MIRDHLVRPLGEAPGLPRLAIAAASALSRIANRRAAPVVLPRPDGPLELRWRPRPEIGGPPVPRDTYRFVLGPYTGHVGLDAPSQAFLFDEPLHASLPSDLRHVLLAHATSAWTESLSRSLRMHVCWDAGDAVLPVAPTPQAPVDAAFFEVQAKGKVAVEGFLAFDQPDAYATLAIAPLASEPAAVPKELHELRMPIAFELGSTTLRLDEMRGIRAGDIVSVDRWQSKGRAVVVRGIVAGHGSTWVALAEGSKIEVQAMNDLTITPLREADDKAQGNAALPLDRLDALEVTLRFEVGDLEVSLGELKSIGPGHVFDLAQPLNRSEVRVLAHGNLLGKGHLVAVGDRLGVRISEFAPKANG
jgi:type III secretion protein Q